VSTNAEKFDLAKVMVRSDIKDPLETFREHVKKGTLTRPLVVLCLEDAVRLIQPDSQMGEAAITWLWISYDSIEYPLDTDLVNAIAILLVREGKEELLWDWMNQESQKPASKSNRYIEFDRSASFDKRYDWRAAAFRGLVEAKVYLATDHSLDAALETYFLGRKVPFYLSTQAAANYCHRMMTKGVNSLSTKRSYEDLRDGLQFTNTSPNLWEAFYKEIGRRPAFC
jgi:hypothetical protein